MSYTNVIANIRTQSHSIVPEAKETTALERITQAQGTGRTGSAIRKVAQFIGMDAPAAPEQLHVKGSLSVDFELERQQWRSSHKYTSALEEAERSARMKDTTTEGARKNRAFVFSKSILQKIQAPIHWTPRDYPASRKFLKYTRDNTTVIEELERLRRKNDTAGESTKRLLARQTSTAIFSDLQNPTLIPVSLGVHPGANLTGKLGEASEIAMKKLLPMAEHFAASAYQIGTFAARAAYFFGGKAAVTAQDLGAKAAVQGQVIGSQALAKGQDLGVKAAVTAQDLGHKAIEEAQYLGGQAIAGAQTLSHTAQQTALNTAATAQNVAHQTIEKTKSLTHQASAAASNAVATVQNMGGQAVEKVKDLAETAMEGSAAELSWNQLNALEEKERSSRIAAQFGSNRFTNALRTSSLIRDEIYAQKGTDENRSGSWYGTFILEETERLRRIVSDKSSPVARINAKRAAAIITLYRNQWSNQTAAQVVPIPQQFVKEVQVQQLAPTRSYQAAM